MVDDRNPATHLLQEIRDHGDDDGAAARLLPLVYDELRQLAKGYMRRERPDHTLEPTALVNEAFFKLINKEAHSFQDKSHFLAVAARAMRQVLVNHAHKHQSLKRGGDRVRVTLGAAPGEENTKQLEVLALDEALTKLEKKHERLSRVLTLRFFAGMTIQETAEALGVSHTTVEGDWTMARAWLSRELDGGGRS